MNISKDGQPSALCWHPHKKVLAVGWDAGYIQVRLGGGEERGRGRGRGAGMRATYR